MINNSIHVVVEPKQIQNQSRAITDQVNFDLISSLNLPKSECNNPSLT